MRTLILLALAGLGAQLVDGSLGMAYGVTSTTLLLAMGANPAAASATVHLAEIGTTLMSGASHWRFLPDDFHLRSFLQARYGAKAIADTMTVQDWPVGYDELEPHYDRFDKVCGVSGKAGNIKGRKIEGGNVFEALMDPVRFCTLGQITEAFFEVGGQYRRNM